MRKQFNLRLLFALFGMLLFTPLWAQTDIKMVKEGGVYKVPCIVNGLKLKLIFDTGASSVCISESVANMMLENDYLSYDDIKGTSKSQVADGRLVDNTKIQLREIKIGDKVLNNIEAVVVHNQNAPLLLGQSVLSRLGKYTISGDRLIFNTHNKSQKLETDNLSEEYIDKLFAEADKAYSNRSYSLAYEKYKILYPEGWLSVVGKIIYGSVCYHSQKYEEAIEVFTSIDNLIDNVSIEKQQLFYLDHGRALAQISAYEEAIPLFEKLKLIAPIYNFYYLMADYYIAYSYKETRGKNSASIYCEKQIKKHLTFFDIKATDCWDKGYQDSVIGEMYYNIAILSEEYEKYAIISAAWGYKNSIESCKKMEADFSKKPSKYEY